MNKIKKEIKIEVCAGSVQSAENAQKAGAARVELCAGMPEGGTTPSWGTIRRARQALTRTKLHVLIRPRGGDFLYSREEQEIMRYDIQTALELGADGVVLGCLTAEGDIDTALMRKLMKAAGKMSVTFHRAFDMCRDPCEALEQIIDLGCERILSSGQENTAEKGIPLLRAMVQQALGRIIVMPGCGIHANNIRKIADETGATEFHLSARTSIESSMHYRNSKISMGGKITIDEYKTTVSDIIQIKAAISNLHSV